MIKSWIRSLRIYIGMIYAKVSHLVLTIMVLGILEVGIYYEMAVSMMAILGPGVAPILIILFIWITYKGIRKLYENSKSKKLLFL
jgi:hypothetical protein